MPNQNGPRDDHASNDRRRGLRGTKSEAIRNHLKKNNRAKPTEVVVALKQKGIDVSPSLVSIIRAKAGVKRARRNAHKALEAHDVMAGDKLDKSAALDAALMLYKAADGRETRTSDVRNAFLRLMAYIG